MPWQITRRATDHYCLGLSHDWRNYLKCKDAVRTEFERPYYTRNVVGLYIFGSTDTLLGALHEKWFLQLFESSLRSLRISVILCVKYSRDYS